MSELVDSMSDIQARDLLKTLIDRLEMAEAEGVFGKDSWHGFLEIEFEVE